MKQSGTLIALILILSAPLYESKFWDITPVTHVYITNNMGDGSKVTVHCHKGGEDLGEQVLADGQTYEIIFHPNIIFTTKYACSFVSEKGHVETDVYEGWRDFFTRCSKNCPWIVKPDSVNGINDGGNVDLYYPWQH